MYHVQGLGADYPSALVSAGRGLQKAILISQDRKYVSVPLLTLAASSSVIRAAAEGHCPCQEVGISLPEFPHHTLEQLADFVSGRDVKATYSDVIHLSEMCTVLGIDLDIHSTEIQKQEHDSDDTQDKVYDSAIDVDCDYEDEEWIEIDRLGDAAVNDKMVDGETPDGTEVTFLPMQIHEDDAPIQELTSEAPNDDNIVTYCILQTEECFETEQVIEACDVPAAAFETTVIVQEKGKKTRKAAVCEVCNKFLKSRKSLARHLRTHTGERPYPCTACEKQFSQKYMLQKHMLVHNGLKPFACPVCQRPFREKGHLDKHLRTHDRLRPYLCDICSDTFTEQGSLNRHRLIHLGKKPFLCSVCGKCFRQKCSLNGHMNIHNREEPLVQVYFCEICEKCFKMKSAFNKHMAAKHQ